MNEKEEFIRDMRMAFDLALAKAVHRGEKPGNSWLPWKTFSNKHLKKRLDEEYNEYLEDPNGQELMDIMNCAAFLLVRRFYEKAEQFAEGTVRTDG